MKIQEIIFVTIGLTIVGVLLLVLLAAFIYNCWSCYVDHHNDHKNIWSKLRRECDYNRVLTARIDDIDYRLSKVEIIDKKSTKKVKVTK